MARKQKQALVPTQYKHLRYADAETGEILNFGGFTVAYRCLQMPSEVVGRPNIQVQYAYSECTIHDNFCKKDGRNRTYNRLANKATDFFGEFDITPQLPEGYEHHIINLGDGIVDIAHQEFNLQRAVIEYFLAECAGLLNVGTEEEGDGNLLNNLFTTESGVLAINSEVLTYVEPSFESVANEVGTTCVRIADEALDTLDTLNLEDSPTTNAEALETIRKALTDIKELCGSMVAASDAGEEEEDDEEDSEEEIEGDEDDEGSDEDDEEDDEESDDEEEGDENPRS